MLLIFPRVGLYPFDLQRCRWEKGSRTGGLGLAKEKKDFDLEKTRYVAFLEFRFCLG